MGKTMLRQKHVRLDQRKLDFARRYFSVASEQEAIDRALTWLMQEQRLTRRLKSLQGILRGDDRPWPYQ